MKNLIEALSTEGGNILVLFLLIFVLGGFVMLNFEKATDQLYFVIGALVGILKGNLSTKKE